MSLHRFQVFASVVRHGSLTKASQQLHCVQSALSRHLKAFQDEYGVLLHTNGRGIEVTERGRALYSELKPLLSQLAKLDEKYRVIGRQAKSLVVGGSRGASKSILPPLITQFMKAHPTVEIELKPGASLDVEDLLLKSDVDLALISDPYPSPLLEMEPFRELKICVFVARHHPLAKRAEIEAEELAQFPIVAGRAKRGEGRFAEFLRRMSSKDVKLDAAIRCEWPNLVKAIVRSGEAVGVLYRDFLETPGSSGVFKIVNVAELNLSVMSYIVYRKDKPLDPNARDFLALLRAARTAPTSRKGARLQTKRSGPLRPSRSAKKCSPGQLRNWNSNP